MTGLRTLILALAVGTAVAVIMPQPDPKREVDLGLVKTGHGLSVMHHEVTIDQWQLCVVDGDCSFQPKPGLGAASGNFPVTGIGALDALEFATWAQDKVSPKLRLPTLAEWYAFSGVTPYQPKEIFTDPRLAWAATYGTGGKLDPTLRQSGGFDVNASGIADVKGNVWEFTATCVIPDFGEARCPAYFAAGEHKAKIPVFVRDPSAGGCATGTPPAHLGLRLVANQD